MVVKVDKIYTACCIATPNVVIQMLFKFVNDLLKC